MSIGYAFVYWNNHAEQQGEPRYYGYAEIEGKRYKLSGWIDTSKPEKRVRLSFRPEKPQRESPP